MLPIICITILPFKKMLDNVCQIFQQQKKNVETRKRSYLNALKTDSTVTFLQKKYFLKG